MSVDPCPRCGVQRCPNCETQRFNTRYEYITRLSNEGGHEVEGHIHEQQDNQGMPLTRLMTVDLPSQPEDANGTSLAATLSNSECDDTGVRGLHCPIIPKINSLIQFVAVQISWRTRRCARGMRLNTHRLEATTQWAATMDVLNKTGRINDLAKPNRPTQHNRASGHCEDIYLGSQKAQGNGVGVSFIYAF